MLLVFESVTAFGRVPGLIYDSIEFDATLSEVHSESSTVTEHPIDKGANISDYVSANLTKVTVEGMITNTPVENHKLRLEYLASPVAELTLVPQPFVLSVLSKVQTSAARIGGGWLAPYQPPLVRINPTPIGVVPAQYLPVPVNVGGVSYQAPKAVNRVLEIYRVLKRLQQNGTSIQVVTQLANYPAMVISSLTAPREAMDAVIFSIEFTQYTTTSTALSTMAGGGGGRVLTADTRAQDALIQFQVGVRTVPPDSPQGSGFVAGMLDVGAGG